MRRKGWTECYTATFAFKLGTKGRINLMGQICPNITRWSRSISFVLSVETSKGERMKICKIVVNKREENLVMIMRISMKLMNKRLLVASQLFALARHLKVRASG